MPAPVRNTIGPFDPRAIAASVSRLFMGCEHTRGAAGADPIAEASADPRERFWTADLAKRQAGH
jgi:hypothetical protein